jgi:hypothetical protein
MASRNPASVLGAKYTTILAPGATAPITSISSMTSVSGPLVSPVGAFWAPSTETAVTVGAGEIFRPLKYVARSDWVNPPPSSMIATVWPDPFPAVGKLYALAICKAVKDVAAGDASSATRK